MAQFYLHNWRQQPQGLEYVDPGESIQAALDRSKVVILTTGQHYADGLSLRRGQMLQGLGYETHLVLNAPIVHDTPNEYSQASNGYISDMRITGTVNAVSAIKIVNAYRFTIRNVYIDGVGGCFTDACIDLVNSGIFNCATITVQDVHLQNGEGVGIRSYRASDDPGAGAATVLIYGGRVQAMAGYGIDMAAGLVSTQALEVSIWSVDIEGNAGAIRGSFRTCNVRGCHFEQGGATLPEDAHIAIRGLRRVEGLAIESCFFSGTAPYSINIGDPSPGGTTLARGVRIATNTFQSHGTAALRLRHVVGLDINTNRVPSGVVVVPQDSWEHCETAQIQDEFGVVESVRSNATDDDLTATMLHRYIVATQPNTTITLPLARELSRNGGQQITVKSRVSGTTVQAQGSDTLEGGTTVLGAGDVLRLISAETTPSGGADRWDVI